MKHTPALVAQTLFSFNQIWVGFIHDRFYFLQFSPGITKVQSYQNPASALISSCFNLIQSWLIQDVF